MLANRFHRAIQRRHRVVAEQKSNPGVILSASLVVKRAKTIQPQGRALSGSDADLQNENVRWKLFMILEVFQQRPEVGDGIGYTFRWAKLVHIPCPTPPPRGAGAAKRDR